MPMIERFLDDTLREKMRNPERCTMMAVAMPGDRDPFERHYGLSVPLDAELRLASLGCSSGGGTLFLEGEEDDDPEICFCIVDVDATDVDGARELLRLHLPELGAPAGTLVQWGEFEDRYDGTDWQLRQPRSLDHMDL